MANTNKVKKPECYSLIKTIKNQNMSTKKIRELYQNLNAYIFYSKEVPKERTLALRLCESKESWAVLKY